MTNSYSCTRNNGRSEATVDVQQNFNVGVVASVTVIVWYAKKSHRIS